VGGRTDRQTDGIGDKPVPTPTYALLYYSDKVKNIYKKLNKITVGPSNTLSVAVLSTAAQVYKKPH